MLPSLVQALLLRADRPSRADVVHFSHDDSYISDDPEKSENFAHLEVSDASEDSVKSDSTAFSLEASLECCHASRKLQLS